MADTASDILTKTASTIEPFPKIVIPATSPATAGQQAVTYRKTTAKAVNTTVAATDLLNGEITIAAGVMSASGMVRLTAWGDWIQNSGGASSPPRFQVVLGGTTLLDTNAFPGAVVASANRGSWSMVIEIMNTGAANAQVANIRADLSNGSGVAGSGGVTFATGNGQYRETFDGVAGDGWAARGNNTTAVDTTLASALVLNVINGSSSASCETKLFAAIVEIV